MEDSNLKSGKHTSKNTLTSLFRPRIPFRGIVVGAIAGFLIGACLEWVNRRETFPKVLIVSLIVCLVIGSLFDIITFFLRKFKRKFSKTPTLEQLPISIADFLNLVIKKMRYRKDVRVEVLAELADHFEDELKDCKTEEERHQKARKLIEEFGDAETLGILLRRAKKRCRPLWRTIAARTFQAIGVLILFFFVYTIWFLTGKPTISVDYLEVLNQMNSPQIRNEDNAWPHYEKAILLFIEPNDQLKEITNASSRISLESLNENEQEKVREWTGRNEAAWQEFASASSKSYCYREYQYDPNATYSDKWLINVLLPHLSDIRKLARVGIWRARIYTDANQPNQAFQDCLAIARCGSQWQGKGTLVEQLVGIAISKMACDEMLNIVAAKSLSSTDLKSLQQQLLQIYQHSFPPVNIEGERLFIMDVVQRVFTEGGFGGGHILPERLASLDLSGGSARNNLAFYTATAMVQAGRDKTIDKANEIYDSFAKSVKMSPYERHVSNTNGIENMISAFPKYRFILLESLMPAIGRVANLMYQGRTSHQATVTILAIHRWQLDKNEYPANLEKIVAAEYLKEVPIDPWSDKPLLFKKTADGFTLYSIGLNFKDDGGTIAKDIKGQTTLWNHENGDAVFWPVAK